MTALVSNTDVRATMALVLIGVLVFIAIAITAYIRGRRAEHRATRRPGLITDQPRVRR